MIKFSVFLITSTVFVAHSAEVQQDSYLDALQRSKDAETINDSRVARDDYSSGYSDNSVGLTSGYDYSPPKPNYGPPSSEYGTGFSSSAPYPPSSYGHPVYGPPKPINMYNYAGPPHAYNLPDEHWLLDKLKFKLDLFTIGKLLIKLIIFKKIVKFIALICLLLWLPKFQSKHMKMDELEDAEDDEDDDEEDDRRRQFGYYAADNRLNELTRFTMTALNAFKKKYSPECENANEIYCRFNAMVNTIDDQYPYTRIMKLYTSDSEQNDQRISSSNVVTSTTRSPASSSSKTTKTTKTTNINQQNSTAATNDA